MAISSNKKILKNTLMLYFRQLLTLLVSLYTVRVVLNELGIVNYGIYNVIGGIVMFFSFLKGTMSSATQRFFSVAIGQDNGDKLNKTFSVNVIIYILIAILSLILLEIAGLWFVKEQLHLPPERYNSSLLIYHFSVLTFFFTIFSTPFMSAIIAHEDMQIYAYVSIVEVILKLVIVFLLKYLSFDKLELYGFLILVVSIITCVIYIVISVRKYNECQLRKFYWDKNLFREIIGFTGWTLFGQITSAGKDQAVTVMLNQFFNPIVVAANSIAKNISTQILMFSNNFNSSLYPPIIKSYAINDKKNMFSLIFKGCKITFFLMWIFALPFFFQMDVILDIWLDKVPQGAVLFTQLALIDVLINSISLPIQTAARAPGRMKSYELILGVIQILIFLTCWITLKMGALPYSVFVISIVANLVMFLVRLLIVRNLIGLPLKSFFYEVVYPVTGVIILSIIPSYVIKLLLPKGVFFTFVSLVLCGIVILISIYYVGLDRALRNKFKGIIVQKFFLKSVN